MNEVIVHLSWHGLFAIIVFVVLALFTRIYYRKYNEEVVRNIKLSALYESIRNSANVDPLTSLFNRRELDQRLNEEIGRAIRYEHDLQVMFIDLDNFKKVNDVCGHTKGDETLREVASRLKQIIRRHDILARYGGDEFVLVLPEISVESAKNVGEKIIEMIENIKIDDCINISASVGIRQFNPENPTGDLIKGADNAMYIAKNGGKGKVHIH